MKLVVLLACRQTEISRTRLGWADMSRAGIAITIEPANQQHLYINDANPVNKPCCGGPWTYSIIRRLIPFLTIFPYSRLTKFLRALQYFQLSATNTGATYLQPLLPTMISITLALLAFATIASAQSASTSTASLFIPIADDTQSLVGSIAGSVCSTPCLPPGVVWLTRCRMQRPRRMWSTVRRPEHLLWRHQLLQRGQAISIMGI